MTNVDQSDSRQYVVRAENDRGMDMVTMQLMVKGKYQAYSETLFQEISFVFYLYLQIIISHCNIFRFSSILISRFFVNGVSDRSYSQPTGYFPHPCHHNHSFIQ